MKSKRIRNLQTLLAAARGDIPVDILIVNSRIINVFNCEVEEKPVAIHNGIIVGFDHCEAREIIDLKGSYLAPGFIDGHIHIESSKLVPARFAEAVAPHGTTSVVSDPHEIANVLGLEGIKFMLENARDLPIDIYYTIPSCVPATNMETSGTVLDVNKLSTLLDEERFVALGEMMNFPGVVNGIDEVISKLSLVRNKLPIDGHSPYLSGRQLSTYLVGGASTDHECTNIEEASEKLSKGMRVMVREGSTARNLEALLPLVTAETERRMMFVSDDRRPGDLFEEGHIDAIVKKAIYLGLDPIIAIKMVTLNPAETYRLERVGGIAPGWRADLVEFADLKDIRVNRVWKGGELVAASGKVIEETENTQTVIPCKQLEVPSLSNDKLTVPDRKKPIRVIDIVPNQLTTKALILDPTCVNEQVISDSDRDILKLVVIERYSGRGGMSVGFVKGFGIKKGALASTVAHDSHNIIAVGVDDQSICTATNRLIDIGGGQIVSEGKTIISEMELPIAGLMSDRPISELSKQENSLISSSHRLGCVLDDPFMALSFLALPVIPELKLTDRGLVDVNTFNFVSLYV